MQSLFLFILKTSLTASCIVILILLIKKLFGRHMDVHFHYYIWFLLLLKLILPYNIESPYSILNVMKPIQWQEKNETLIEEPQTQPLYQIVEQKQQFNIHNESDSPAPVISDVQFPLDKSLDFLQVLAVVWLFGCILVSSTTIFSRIVFEKRLHKNKDYANESILSLLESIRKKMNIKRNIPIIFDKKVNSPAIYSVLFPKLIMPLYIIENFTSDEIDFVFRHELTHYKKKDLIIFAFVSIMRAVYWFNPLLWYAFYEMECDCESSCDANVLKDLRYEERQRYGMTIIKTITLIPATNIPIVNLGVGKSNSDMKRRINMIAKFQQSKAKTIVTIMFIGLIVIMSVTFFTNPLTETVNAGDINPAETTTAINENALLKNEQPLATSQHDIINPIFYDEVNNCVVVRKTEKIKTSEDVMQIDAYWDKIYTFTVEGLSEAKNYQINGPLVKSINLNVIDGASTMTIIGNEIFAFASTEDENNIYFMAKTPKEVYKYIVVVDPSHGGSDTGAKYEDPYAGLSVQEKDLTLSLAKEIEYISEHTKDSKLKIYLTHIADEKIKLEDAVEFANKLGGIYIGIHYNTGQKRDLNGTETFYFESNKEGKRLAEIIQSNLTNAVNTKNGGSKPADYYMIKNTMVPAIDVEVAYISNANDLQIILSDDFTENATLSILNGVNEYFGIIGKFVQVPDISFKWPVPSYNRISSGYGARKNPLTAETEFHNGIDIPAPLENDVIAVADGKVIMIDDNSNQGKAITIEHNDTLKTIYAHNSKILKQVGEYVLAGDLIAKSGSTGDITGPALHFEVHKNGVAVNPVPFLE